MSIRQKVRTFGHPVLALNLLLALITFLALIALGQWVSPHEATVVDEYYFAACAVREMHDGLFPLLSCHDNKAPLIFQLYRQIFAMTSPYDMRAIRIAGVFSAFFYAAVFSLAALRLSGRTAAVITATLVLSGLSMATHFIALRTYLVGDIFVAIGLLILCRPRSVQSLGMLFSAGLFFGLAVMTNQAITFAGFAVIVWLLLYEQNYSVTSLVRLLTRALAFGSGVLIPLLGFITLYALHDKTGQFFQEIFLFPSIYGTGKSLTVIELGRRVFGALLLLQRNFLLFICFSVAAFTLIVQSRRMEIGPASRFSDPRWLILLVVLGLISAWIPPGNYFLYYLVSVTGPMALFIGVIAGDYWENISRSAPRAIVIFGLTALLVQGSMMLKVIKSRLWDYGSEMISAQDKATLAALKLQKGDSSFAYIFGWEAPYLYKVENFIPASDILYPWALSGQHEKWGIYPYYHMPQAGDRRVALLKSVQKNNRVKLFSDFEKTPPRYIFVYTDLDRQFRSAEPEAVPGLRSYIAANCRRAGELSGPPAFAIYDCNAKS